MGNLSASPSGNRKPIIMKHGNRTGAYMNYWSVAIGSYQNDLIDLALKNQLISECEALITDQTRSNYRNKELTNSLSLRNIKIQDLIEPSNTGTVEYVFNDIKAEDLVQCIIDPRQA
eukprot:316340_1